MPAIKITANTKAVKQSLIELKRDFDKMGQDTEKLSIFDEKDKKFIEEELNKSIDDMGKKLDSNKKEASEIVDELSKVEQGSKREVELRKKIIALYKEQKSLAAEIVATEKMRGGLAEKESGMLGGMAGGFSPGAIAAKVAMAGGVYAIGKGTQAAFQYAQGADDRVRLKGLDVSDQIQSAPSKLAQAGLTPETLRRQQIQGAAILGRAGGSEESVIQKAQFERSRGLEAGSLMGLAGSMRAQFGGQGADEAVLRLEASILASGIEDALAPYLDAATGLLTQINENGMTQTRDLIRVMGSLVASGARTPEQVSRAFSGIDASLRGSSGEANAFFQAAFARAGIGGETIGGARMAVESGLFGLDRKELESRGLNPTLLENMANEGQFSTMEDRSGALLQQFGRQGGLSEGQKISDITDVNQMYAMSSMANQVFGTKGIEGFDLLKVLEDVTAGTTSKEEFERMRKELTEKSPDAERLEKINESLAGQTTILRDQLKATMEILGNTTVMALNALRQADLVGTEALADAARFLVEGNKGKGGSFGGATSYEERRKMDEAAAAKQLAAEQARIDRIREASSKKPPVVKNQVTVVVEQDAETGTIK